MHPRFPHFVNVHLSPHAHSPLAPDIVPDFNAAARLLEPNKRFARDTSQSPRKRGESWARTV